MADQPRRAPHRGHRPGRRSSSAAWRGATRRPAEPPGPCRLSCRRPYLFSHCDLAYATTPHAAQGRTVDTGHVLVDGLGDRQGLYVAMSRGREANYAYCVTGFPRAADAREGSRPAPELARTAQADRANVPGSAARTGRRRRLAEAPAARRGGGPRRGDAPRRGGSFRDRNAAPASCPTPTTSGVSAPSGTTWPAGRRPPGSSRHCAPASRRRRRRGAQRPCMHLALAVAARSRSSRAGRRPGAAATRSRPGR